MSKLKSKSESGSEAKSKPNLKKRTNSIHGPSSDVVAMSAAVKQKFDTYPKHIQPLMLKLRSLALDCVGEQHIETIQETLKWGEPSYLAKHGSTLRMDWKSRSPDQIGLYFTCQSTLVETFQEVYGDLFRYESNRAILLDVNQFNQDALPRAQIQHCMLLALSYHKRKHLPLLGA